MAEIRAKVWVTREGEKRSTEVIFKELGNGSPYGSGQYISVTMPDGTEWCEDFRYMIGYNFRAAVKEWIDAYFGKTDKVEYSE